MKKGYYKELDVLRFFSCISVLLYHLGLLKGGYLAVCVFFVLSGYLTCISLFKEDKVNLVKYYTNRFKKIYLPLCLVVFITCLIVLSFNTVLLNLKPEVYSILLLYNNYWQIGANLDYFARFVSSPFMHFWYIAILLQFELIFPIIFIGLRKVADKFKKSSCIILSLISIVFCSYFVYLSYSRASTMMVYYSTMSRIFSLFFGVSIAFIHHYFKPVVFKINKYNRFIYYGYLVVLLLLFLFVDASSKLFCVSMILSSIVTCRIIDYVVCFKKSKLNKVDNVVKCLASISYEVYLCQYPIIYILEYFKVSRCLIVVLTIILSFLIGYIIHVSYNTKLKKKDKTLKKICKYIIVSFISILASLGLIRFIMSYDYSKDMKDLESELLENEKLMEKRQKAYLEKDRQEKEEFQNKLKELEEDESKLGEVISSLRITGVGDSVMLGAVDNLYNQFPNGYFDAKKSRTDYEANKILVDLKNNGILGDIVVFNLGTNGSGPDSLKYEIENTLEGRVSYWVTVVNDSDVFVNDRLRNYAMDRENVRIIDWESYSKGHTEYFSVDGIHLTEVGRSAYVKCIYDAIYNDYLNDLKRKQEEVIKENDSVLKTKYSFFGNDLLVNCINELGKEFSDASYYSNGYDVNSLLKDIRNYRDNNLINYNVLIMLDSSVRLSNDDVNLVLNELKDYKVYFVLTYKLDYKIDAKVIDFYNEVLKNSDYFMADGIHLSKTGNKELVKFIKKNIG